MDQEEIVEGAKEEAEANCKTAEEKEGGCRGGQGSGGGQGGGWVVLNGIDVSNRNHMFSREEWNRLKGHWQYIWDESQERQSPSTWLRKGTWQGGCKPAGKINSIPPAGDIHFE